MRKKILSVVCAAFAMLFVGMYAGQMLSTNGNAAATSPAPDFAVSAIRTLDVTGVGSIKAKPDIAVLNIGVTTTGETTDIQSENTKAMNKVLEAVKALGVDEKDIRTVNYYMNPNYDYSNYEKGSNKIVGYTLSNMIEVKVRKIDKAGEVLSAAIDAGANVNNGIAFTLSNTEEYYNQALTKAFENAKSKADTLAKTVGVKIGLPARVSENSNYYTPYVYGNYNSGAAMAAGEARDAAAVSQGEIEVTASISVSYEY